MPGIPFRIRSAARSCSSSLIPGSCLSRECVIRIPATPGISTVGPTLRCSLSLGKAMTFSGAGAGSVSHIPSIAASLVGWALPATKPSASPRVMTPDHGEHAEQGAHAQRTARNLDMAPLAQVPGADGDHEDRAGDVTRDRGVHELGLGVVTEQQVKETGQLHALRHGVEGCTHGILHEAVGHQDPQRRQVRTQRDQDR